MKAIVIEAFGDESALKLAEVQKPTPDDHEVLIQVEYAGLNPVDWKIREGLLKSRLPHQFPLIPGWDAAGIITAVGKHTHHLKVGDEVYAYCRKPIVKEGTYAEFVTFDATHVALKPKNLSFAKSAAIPLVALTAWQALFDFGHIKPGQKILVHAGSGGVGGFAIQFAKLHGAEVFTTSSAKNHPYVKSLGADHAVDYSQKDYLELLKKEAPLGFDLIFDTVGGKTLEDSLPLVKTGGTLVSIVEPITQDLGAKYMIRTGFVFVRPNGEQLKEIAHLIEEGKVKALEIKELPLKEAALGQVESKTGHTCGKIVLKIKD